MAQYYIFSKHHLFPKVGGNRSQCYFKCMKHEVTTALNFAHAVTPFLNSLHVIIACKHNVKKNGFLFLYFILDCAQYCLIQMKIIRSTIVYMKVHCIIFILNLEMVCFWNIRLYIMVSLNLILRHQIHIYNSIVLQYQQSTLIPQIFISKLQQIVPYSCIL